MVCSSWVGKFKNLVNQPPFLIVLDLLNKIPGRSLRLALFFLLDLAKPLARNARGFAKVREGTLADVGGMHLLENKEELFFQRLKEGEFCVVAVHDSRIVGYMWFSDKAFHVEDRFKYRLTILEDPIYAYDGFIKREYRLRGIWVLFQEYVRAFSARKILPRDVLILEKR